MTTRTDLYKALSHLENLVSSPRFQDFAQSYNDDCCHHQHHHDDQHHHHDDHQHDHHDDQHHHHADHTSNNILNDIKAFKDDNGYEAKHAPILFMMQELLKNQIKALNKTTVFKLKDPAVIQYRTALIQSLAALEDSIPDPKTFKKDLKEQHKAKRLNILYALQRQNSTQRSKNAKKS